MGLPAHSNRTANEVQSRVALSDSSDPESTDLETIREILYGSFKTSRAWSDDGSDLFLPRNALGNILTEKTIRLLLMKVPETHMISVEEITGEKKRIKIFAILLLIGETKHIGPIIEQGVSDDDLPLYKDRLESFLPKPPRLADLFVTYQCRVDVPVWDFSPHNFREENYYWHRKLPFMTKCRLSSGGQGVVWKVEIHPDHYETKIQSVS